MPRTPSVMRLVLMRPSMTIGALLVSVVPAFGQVAAPRPAGRVSFFTSAARISADGDVSSSSAEFVTSMTYGLTERQDQGVEFNVDLRHARPTARGRTSRFSVYDAYVGARFAGGILRVRGGLMWLNELGGLGSVAGAAVEYRQPAGGSLAGRVRLGAFAGAEPSLQTLGYVQDIRKAGGYVSLEGRGGRRHVAGFVHVRHGGLVERSVLSVTNFIPLHSRVFAYQMAEYDLAGPAGQGTGRLTYFFLNARVSASQRVELQAILHRGRSIDARTITDDVLHGRSVPAGALDGLQYESVGGRATIEVARRVRVNAGYTRDRNNRDSAPTGRMTLGASAQDVAGSGVDLTVSDAQVDRPTGRYHSTYASVGRQLGRRLYASFDFSSAVSIVRFTRSDGLTIEMRPETTQVGGSIVMTAGRNATVLVTASRTTDLDAREFRLLAGLTYRVR